MMRFFSTLFLLTLFLLVGGCQSVPDEEPQVVLNLYDKEVPLDILLLPLYMYPEGYTFVQEQPIPPHLLVCSKLQVKGSSMMVLQNYRTLLTKNKWHIAGEPIVESSSFMLRAEKKEQWVEVRAVQGQSLTAISIMMEVDRLSYEGLKVPRKGGAMRKHYIK